MFFGSAAYMSALIIVVLCFKTDVHRMTNPSMCTSMRGFVHYTGAASGMKEVRSIFDATIFDPKHHVLGLVYSEAVFISVTITHLIYTQYLRPSNTVRSS